MLNKAKIFVFVFLQFCCETTVSYAQKTTCGTSALHHRVKRIIGGYDVVQHEFPWQAALRWRVGKDKGDHICGGALIAKNFVLTAAHCFEHGEDTSYYDVTLGDHSSLVMSGREQTRRINRIITNPMYNSTTYDSDVTLIELQNDVVINDYVNTICLPSFADFEFPDKMCTVTGWGGTVPDAHNNPPSTTLKKANVPIVRVSVCNHQRSYAGKITGNMFCAGHVNGTTDTCEGDSGGPLQCFTSNRWLLNGITSWGVGCGRKHKYGVYVIVRHYVTWINNIISKTIPPVPGTPPIPSIPGTPPIPPVSGTPPKPSIPGTPPIPPVSVTPTKPSVPGTPPKPSVPRTPPIPPLPGTPSTQSVTETPSKLTTRSAPNSSTSSRTAWKTTRKSLGTLIPSVKRIPKSSVEFVRFLRRFRKSIIEALLKRQIKMKV